MDGKICWDAGDNGDSDDRTIDDDASDDEAQDDKLVENSILFPTEGKDFWVKEHRRRTLLKPQFHINDIIIRSLSLVCVYL